MEAQARKTYAVTVALTGRRAITTVGATVPFLASSSQVNFGCEQTVSARALWQAPLTAVISGNVKAAWINTANAKSSSANASIQDGTVVGSGTITGLDVQAIDIPFAGRIANCPGGGHGEIVVSGEYVTRSTGEEPFQAELTGSVSTSPGEARVIRLALPTPSDVALQGALVSLRQGADIVDKATIELRGASPNASHSSDKKLFSVVLEEGQLRITLDATM